MPDVAFVTYQEQPQLTPDDRPLTTELHRLGWGASAHCWDDADVDWAARRLAQAIVERYMGQVTG